MRIIANPGLVMQSGIRRAAAHSVQRNARSNMTWHGGASS
jgi:hypothetical protein